MSSSSEEQIPTSQSQSTNSISPPDVLRILVVTDTHIGYMERDPIRGNDSFVTWEEVLMHAKKMNVDFILHGGDLFHDNKPSRRTLYKTMEAIRKYCFGDQSVPIQIVSDQAQNFPNFKTVNYEDPNFNISIPIFVIHGNHDDPSGDGQYSALDLLSVCNFVNYFGKCNNIDDVTIYPILLTKGKTKLALYGMGNIRDERLFRTFQQKKVKLMRPVESRDEWFNLFLIHQNRVAHSPKNYVHEAFLDGFLNLIIWGHEHECLINPTPATEAEFWVTQPGSTIATSLSEFEAKKKHIGLLEICGGQFRMKPIPLSTVRPYIIEDIVLASVPGLEPGSDNVVRVLEERVELMLQNANQAQIDASLPPTQPLVRLKVDYTGFSTINTSRFGQQFVGKVANPNDILLFHRKAKGKIGVNPSEDTKEAENELFSRAVRPDPLDLSRIEDLLLSFLGPHAGGTVELLPENDFTNALNLFVEKEEGLAISEFVQKKLQTIQKFLEEQDPTKTKSLEDIHSCVVQHTIKQQTLENLKKQENQNKPQGQLRDGGGDDDKVIDLLLDEGKAGNKDRGKTHLNEEPKGGKGAKAKKKEGWGMDEDKKVEDDDMFDFLGDDDDDGQKKKGKQEVKVKKESASQVSQTRKRPRATTIDNFIAPDVPSQKKAKTTTPKPKKEPPPKKPKNPKKNTNKQKKEVTSSKTTDIFEILGDDDDDGGDDGGQVDNTTTVLAKKWGTRKKSL